MVALTALAIASIGIGVTAFTKTVLAKSLDEKMADNSIAALTEMDNWLTSQKNLAICFSEDPDALAALRGDGSESDLKFRQTLLRVKKTTGIERIFICGMDGIVRASSQPDTVGKTNLHERDYIQSALAGKMAISEALMSKVSHRPIIAISVPLRDSGKVVGTLACILDLGTISKKMIEPYKILDSGYVFMFDRTGKILAHPDESLILKTSLEDFTWGSEVKSRKMGFLTYDREGTEKRMYFASSDTYGWGTVATVPTRELTAPVRKVVWTVLLSGLTLLAAGVILSIFTARSVTKPVESVVQNMDELALQSTAASEQVAQASNMLAGGANEQAAALEETRASLEQVSQLAARNAEDANDARSIAKETRQAAEAGAGDMEKMNRAMHEIKASSDNVREIVRTIDEIAFQTNILALNAAVEAARAGESGAGFAVVAEEVRNLAQRSAEAARRTAEKIEESMVKTDNGVNISEKVSGTLREIVGKIHNVDEIVTRQADISGQQKQGMIEVSHALESMNSITQNNAASAEQCAGAAAEMNSQSDNMREIVGRLETIARGSQRATSPQPVKTLPAREKTLLPSGRA